MGELDTLKLMLGITGNEQDDLLTEYLQMAESEIMAWLYINTGDVPDDATFPARYKQVKVMACVTGFNLIGAENETNHSESGVSRTFKYEDMLQYIHSHVYSYVGIPT